jgi:hypothetical protein
MKVDVHWCQCFAIESRLLICDFAGEALLALDPSNVSSQAVSDEKLKHVFDDI